MDGIVYTVLGDDDLVAPRDMTVLSPALSEGLPATSSGYEYLSSKSKGALERVALLH